MTKPLICHTPGEGGAVTLLVNRQKKITTSSAAPNQMKFYTKCKISGILQRSSFIIKYVKLQSPNLQKHPSANTSIIIYCYHFQRIIDYSFHYCFIYK